MQVVEMKFHKTKTTAEELCAREVALRTAVFPQTKGMVSLSATHVTYLVPINRIRNFPLQAPDVRAPELANVRR